MKKQMLDILTSEDFKEKYKIGHVIENNGKKMTVVANCTNSLEVSSASFGDLIVLPINGIEGVNTKNGKALYFTLAKITGVGIHPFAEDIKQKLNVAAQKEEIDTETKHELNTIVYDLTILGDIISAPNEENVEFYSLPEALNPPIKYTPFKVNAQLLDLILNHLISLGEKKVGVFATHQSKFWNRLTGEKDVEVKVSLKDFLAKKTAFFGQSRSGKTNTAILLTQLLVDEYKDTGILGQLIFDTHGEFCKNTTQNSICFSKYNEDCCIVYSYNNNDSHVERMSLNFYTHFSVGQEMLKDLIVSENESQYIKSFFSVEIPSIKMVRTLEEEYLSLKKNTKEWYIARRKYSKVFAKLLLFWSALKKAGFKIANEQETLNIPLNFYVNKNVETAIEKKNKNLAKDEDLLDENRNLKIEHKIVLKEECDNLDEILETFQILFELNKENTLKSTNGNFFDADDMRMLKFIFEQKGCDELAALKHLHKEDGKDFLEDIKAHLQNSKVVIIDLSNTKSQLKQYFSALICESIFLMREKIFGVEKKRKYIQIYFEEAHELFPPKSKDLNNIYARIAKEGSKLGLGIFLSTQSPSDISDYLLNEINNIFIGYLSSTTEAKLISKRIAKFDGLEDIIVRSDTPGRSYMLTQSNKFVISCKIDDYNLFIKKGMDERRKQSVV